ncbi:methyltransferase domain-containing protein [Candidatus Falkowbacteria bacterium]|nr:methyltransferase domain-containing protein [Candidatus Falkowbacteria bacterium]
MSDWSPETYSRFRGLRLRPALDLIARIGALPPGDLVDLGCGNGAVGPALRARFAGRRLVGIDASPAMLEAAAATGAYDALTGGDVARWQPETPPALIFSNALLHWLPDHAALLHRLAGLLAPGGVLAVQMPRQHSAPSHRFLRDFAAEMFPDRFDFSHWQPPVAMPADYHRMLAPLGAVDVWQTDYVQRLEASAAGHPVRRFTEATAMRPFLDKMTEAEAATFAARYDAALAAAYPVEQDGGVLFPFRRLFFTLTV